MMLSEASTTPSKRVLLVEDDPTIRSSLGRFLEHRGFSVDTACNGVEGIDSLARKGGADAVIVDLMMPQMNGMTFLERVKKMDPDISIVMITGYADIKVAIEAMKKGADDFVTKPLQYEQLTRLVSGLVDRTRINRKTHYDDLRRLNRTLQDKVQELSVLYSISEAMNTGDGDFSMFDMMTDLAAKISDSDTSMFFLHDKETGRLFMRNVVGQKIMPCCQEPVQLDKELYEKLFEDGKTTIMRPEKGPWPCDAESPECDCSNRWFMLSPLVIKGEKFGLLVLSRQAMLMSYNKSDTNFIEMLLKKAALSIENNALYESLYSNMVNTLRSLVHTIEAKDVYTQQHSDRVTNIAVRIAQSLLCSDEEVETLKFAGVLHDIGKIGISDAILQKSGSLTDEEYEIIKTHPVVGARILEPLGMMPMEKAIIRHHHERWDGNGYPDGLSEKKIPFLARIVALADAYDAMTSSRIYRKALTRVNAISEIERNAGSQFDPMVVAAFKRLCDHSSLDATRN